MSTLPPSTTFLCVYVDAAFRKARACDIRGFADCESYWPLVWQAAALKGSIRSIAINIWKDESSVSSYPLLDRDVEWEDNLLEKAERVLGGLGYNGGAYAYSDCAGRDTHTAGLKGWRCVAYCSS